MMIQENSRKDEMNLSLLEIISSNDVAEYCAKITNWLEHYYHMDGIGFFLQDIQSTRTYFHSEDLPEDIIQGLEETISRPSQMNETVNDILLFGKKQGKIDFFSPQEDRGSLKPMGLIFPLKIQDRSIGNLAIVVKSSKIQSLINQISGMSPFIPLISSLLNNAISHEQKDKKIRMLNLYQTVSSSLAYIHDLQELLTMIISIVTSELFCEECSVLFYDSENNEFEFFTAVGETGMHLLKERFPANEGIAGRALRERTTQVVNDVQSDPDFYGNIDKDHNFKTKSILAAPLIAGEEIIGILNAINKIESKFFDQNDDQVLSAIADEVALAVKNARLFNYVVDSYCKIRQGQNSCKGCKRPLKSWTPCAKYLGLC
jgi:putative methionine-R-sulfoxide reductase with GAF domain